MLIDAEVQAAPQIHITHHEAATHGTNTPSTQLPQCCTDTGTMQCNHGTTNRTSEKLPKLPPQRACKYFIWHSSRRFIHTQTTVRSREELPPVVYMMSANMEATLAESWSSVAHLLLSRISVQEIQNNDLDFHNPGEKCTSCTEWSKPVVEMRNSYSNLLEITADSFVSTRLRRFSRDSSLFANESETEVGSQWTTKCENGDPTQSTNQALPLSTLATHLQDMKMQWSCPVHNCTVGS